ncbi:MAG: RNA polymerase sigma factor [Nitrososphaerales archaeon]
MYAAIDDRQVLAIIPACQEGEAGAVTRLYDLYADRIYHYGLARTGAPRAAEDLTGEVFLKVVKHVQRFKLDASRPASSVSAWLYRIAANLVIDYHRSIRRRPQVDLDEDVSMSLQSPDPCEEVERQEALRRLSGALEQLTEEQRLVVISKFGEGLSNAQTAAWLGKTEGAIEGLQHRALRTLSRLLGARQGME